MSIVAAEIGGFVFQFAGTGVFVTIGVNLFGFSILLGTAALMNFVKREPWARSYAKRDMTISDQTLKQ
jgi:hypothetical protein